MDLVITPEPHLIPGYTGHCTQNRLRIGKTYGKQTHKLLIDPCINHAEDLIVSRIDMQHAVDETPSPSDIETLKQREKLVDAVYHHPIIPGYAGFVPKLCHQTGSRYMAAATTGLAEFERLMELLRCEKRNLEHRDLLESGRGIFENRLGERVMKMAKYRAPLIPVMGRSKALQNEKCPPKLDKLRYSKFTTPHFLEDDDEDKYIINGYAGHTPMAACRFGETNHVLAHNALCNFSDVMKRRQQDRWCCAEETFSKHVELCPQKGHFEIYHKEIGMIPSYMGHVPGANYKVGSTFGVSTVNAKHWLERHKNLTTLPEIAVFE